jgi:hypothetical protein
MSRKVGQIIARGERRWLVRVYLGRNRDTRKRTYHNRTIYGSLRHAQAYLTKRLHERDLSRGVEGLQVTVDEFLDHWLKTAVKPKVRAKTHSDYAAKHDALILRCEPYQRIWQSQDRMPSIHFPRREWTADCGVTPELSRNP